ncbi:hypothetical protein SAY86_030970 [Trapa natans]|uniref:protein-serine/threonine phosphatase n=1 Tax=Trapa natans TaxID=22666 RepID=A0AAN7M600_TRANT|nr:hypothetical protein SAY86_030970 [Trapa natans]
MYAVFTASLLLISISCFQQTLALRPLGIFESLRRGPVPPSRSSPCTYIPGGRSRGRSRKRRRMEQSVLDDIIARLLEVRTRPGKLVQLSESEIGQLCLASKDIFLQQPNLLELEAPVKICGIRVVEDGYEFFADRQLVTIFSAPNYCGEFDNAGAMMTVDETLMCSFQILKPADKKPRYYNFREGAFAAKLGTPPMGVKPSPDAKF